MRIVIAVFLLLGASLGGQAGEAHFGVWQGTLTEMVEAGQRYEQYEVTLTVTPKAYQIDYASLGCGGILRLVKQAGRFYRFRDEFNYGLQNCISDGYTEIHFINQRLAAFQWYDKDGSLKVEGYLKRQAQIML
ncbi:MAG TPA: hypothetical protein ENI97_09295 [Gammaproteobacteria bacterium]|nr:hypothetical protein [Gammaproteobacteria bacterium]